MSLFLDFDSIASIDPFFKSSSRHLLSASAEELQTAEQRLQNDVDRTVQFLLTFIIFSTSWCLLSCFIYNRPHDGPGGTSLVSHIRRLPLLKWFFQQHRSAITSTNEAPIDSSETESLKRNEVSIEMTAGNNTEKSTDNDNTEQPELGDVGKEKQDKQSDDPIDSKEKPKTKKLLVCAIGLLVAYSTWGFMQERIMGHPYGEDPNDELNWFKYSSFCVMLNRMFGLLVSSVVLRFIGRSGNTAPPYVVSLCALSNMSSSWFQYEALHYVTFPVQTIFKSSKILITMAVGKFVLKKTFSVKKYINSGVVAIGVYIFLSAQKAGNKSDEDGGDDDEDDLGMYFYLGLGLISGYAFCDAFTSNWQQRIFKNTNVGSLEMMQSVNAFTFIVSLFFTVNDFYDIYLFYMSHPLIILHSLLMGLCAGFGQVLIFYTIQTFGAMKFATVMTTRMMCSVIISILYYGHPLTGMGIFGMGITFCALYYQAFSKGGPKRSK